MPKKLPKTTFKARLGRSHKPFGNLIIYVPKMETEIHGFKPGDLCEITIEVLKKAEVKKAEE